MKMDSHAEVRCSKKQVNILCCKLGLANIRFQQTSVVVFCCLYSVACCRKFASLSSGEHQFLAAEEGFASSNHAQFHCTCLLVNLLLSVSITPV